MADGAESCRNTDGIPHPFAVDEGRTCSAFSVVTSSKKEDKGQFAAANSRNRNGGRNSSGIPGRANNSRNESAWLSERTHSTEERSVPYNTDFPKSNNTRIAQERGTSALNQPRVAFWDNNPLRERAGAKLRTDAIGPGVILETPNISSSSNWAQSTNFNDDLRTSHDEGPLRHRGKRQESTNTIPTGCRSQDCRQHQCNTQNRKNAVPSRARLTNNLELLSRPSWCDAKFAYDQVLQGKANGSKGALWFRSILHRLLFRLGCFLQRRAGPILFLCLIFLAACSIGLKFRSIETRVEKLWVESGGVMEKELEYTKNSIGDGMDTTWQILIQTGQDTATVSSLQLHLKAALAATKVTVTVYDQDWELADLCYKDLPDLGETSLAIEQIIEKIFPCFIMGPLDCFYEGAELLGPSTPFAAIPYRGFEIPAFTWKTLNPKELIDLFEAATSDSISSEVKIFSDLVKSAGVEYGYQNRWCLDPYNPECPDLAPNKFTKQIPDVKGIINEGCAGYATKFMKWSNDLIVGGLERDKQGNITRARGLQTLIHLMGPSNMYNFHKNNIKVQNWNPDKAENVLTMWQRKFVEEMYRVIINASSFSGQPDEIHAFAPSTAQDLILEFSNFSIVRVAAGYILMLVYACFTMLRCKASRSQGAVGVVGVLLVALSVMAGLGICSVLGIQFNAATTQVLPFLMLGLGVDDMFLIAHQFGEIACLNYIPFEERTGECLKRVGVSVLLTSIAILSGFLFSMIIPMPALRSFALQAAVITCFNLFCVLIAFPATLSIDLKRRKKNMLDIFCCFQSSSANDVVELSEFTHEVTTPRERPTPVARFTTLPAAPHQTSMEPEATITMHHTIQTFPNESYVTVLGPAAETTFGPINNANKGPGPSRGNVYNHPLTPPPRYTPDGRPEGTSASGPPVGPREAFKEQVNKSENTTNANSSTISSGDNSRTISTHTTTKKPSSVTPRRASSNLVTPMVSVRSSTHSLVPAAQSRASKWFCWARKNSKNNSKYNQCFPFLSLSDIARKYYGPFLMKTPVKVVVVVMSVLLVGGSVYGCLRVRDGLDLVDILPRDTREHAALSAQLEYFSFYQMYIITQDFDYAHNQRQLHMLHENVSALKYVVKETDGSTKKFWLEHMRDWLANLQRAFDYDWSKGHINKTTWKPQASDEGKLAFKLLLQTGKLEEEIDYGRIGCEPLKSQPCERVNVVRLVSDDGIIREDAFYNYLTAWAQGDPLAYLASQAQIVPAPEKWVADKPRNYVIIRSKAITYAQMPYFLNDLRENEDFVDVIKSVRGLCEHYGLEGVKSYPSGYPFLFWQQYIDLRQWLFVAMGAAVLAISGVIALVLLNPWAAGITCLFLLIITTELLGFMGIVGIKLSAVPSVILIAAIGLGVEFTVHITLAFITSCGSRDDRAKSAISHMMGPVVDGAVSTFLGVVMLSGSEFDFVIRYFFQVLAVLVLIGLWNGIILLPVVLSLIGPRPEVVPRGGGNRLKTPTPPPSPTFDEDETVCPNCNNSNASRYPRYPDYCGQYSSRDDVSYMQRSYPCEDAYYNGSRTYYPPPHQRYPTRSHFHHSEYPMGSHYQCQTNPGYSHPHSTGNSGSSTPRAPLEDARVLIYPDVVLFSRQPEHTRVKHCDSPARVAPPRVPSTQRHPADDQRRDEGTNGGRNPPPQQPDRGQPIATVTSSLTVKYHPARNQRIPIYLQPSSNIVNHSLADSTTLETRFHPIPDKLPASGDLSRPVKIVPSYQEAVRETLRNNPNNSGNGILSDRNEISPNIDETSDAVDSIFKRLGNSDVTG